MSAPATDKLIKYLADGKLRSIAELQAAGINRMTVKRAAENGHIRRYAKQLYLSGEAEFVSGMSLAAIAKVQDGIVCMGSAAQFHELGDEDPSEIWFAVDRKRLGKSRIPGVEDPHRVLYWQGNALEVGIEVHTIAGVDVKITSAARTVVDLLRYRGKIGEEAGPKALKDYLTAGKMVSALWSVAKALGCEGDLVPFLRLADELSDTVTPAKARH